MTSLHREQPRETTRTRIEAERLTLEFRAKLPERLALQGPTRIQAALFDAPGTFEDGEDLFGWR